ncbi:MAG: hypothetical protein ABR578_00975 [Chromatocurvus sp.]
MNIRTLIIRFGLGTLLAASAVVSAEDYAVDLAAAEIVSPGSASVSADITARHEPFTEFKLDQPHGEADRAHSELRLADDMARKLGDQLERRLASRLDEMI